MFHVSRSFNHSSGYCARAAPPWRASCKALKVHTVFPSCSSSPASCAAFPAAGFQFSRVFVGWVETRLPELGTAECDVMRAQIAPFVPAGSQRQQTRALVRLVTSVSPWDMGPSEQGPRPTKEDQPISVFRVWLLCQRQFLIPRSRSSPGMDQNLSHASP